MTTVVAPPTLEDALGILGTADSAVSLAGGTALQMRRRRGQFCASTLVDLRLIPGMDRIEITRDRLIIGALVTHRRVETDPVIARHAPILSRVYSQIANVRVRNVATVGGNLADADHRLDPPGALGVLGAEVELASARGRRTVAVADLFSGFQTSVLARDEILTAVHVPRRSPQRWGFLKFKSLGRNDWPCVGIAASLGTTTSGARELTVGITAVSPVPIHRVLDVTGLADDEVLDALDATVVSAVDPVSDLRGSARFKRRVARVTAADAVRPLLAGVAGR
jgi:aerobic carbon-monoxide dehydrogenase medium subunit